MNNNAITIANWFIARANRESVDGVVEGITPLKLQKILYLAQAAHLGLGKGPLFDDEIVAWKLGPVVESVYQVFKSKKDQITSPTDNDYLSLNNSTSEFLEEIWDMFGKYTAYRLVELTHSHLPWKEANQNEVISKTVIANYYKNLFVETENE